jgi:hypothetical protein
MLKLIQLNDGFSVKDPVSIPGDIYMRSVVDKGTLGQASIIIIITDGTAGAHEAIAPRDSV